MVNFFLSLNWFQKREVRLATGVCGHGEHDKQSADPTPCVGSIEGLTSWNESIPYYHPAVGIHHELDPTMTSFAFPVASQGLSPTGLQSA